VSDTINIYQKFEGKNCLCFVLFIVQLLSNIVKDVGISNVTHIVIFFCMQCSSHGHFKIKFLLFVKVVHHSVVF